MDILAQIFGLGGTAMFILSFQCRDTRRLFLVQTLSTLLFSLHYAMLGAWAGVVMDGIATARGALLFFGRGGWTRGKPAMWTVVAAFAVGGALTYDGWLSLLPVAAMIAATLTQWTRRPGMIRVAQLCAVSPLWMGYNIAVGSVFGYVTDALNMLSVIISLIRFGLRGKRPEEDVRVD